MTWRLRMSRFSLALALMAVCFAACAAGESNEVQDLSTFPRTTIEIHSKAHTQKFNVWVADTPARQAQGLMYVRDLPADEGMIFLNQKPRVAAMWMKNTFIALDILFVTQDKRITKIAEKTVPLSLATIGADVPVIAVIELKGGEAARRGLKVGDQVEWKPNTKS